MPLFGEFFQNVSLTEKECLQKIEDSTAIMMPKQDLEVKLKDIETECYDSFIGFMMEVVTTIDETMGISPDTLIDIIVGGVRVPVELPLKCVANELTSMFPTIMISNGEISTKVNLITHVDL